MYKKKEDAAYKTYISLISDALNLKQPFHKIQFLTFKFMIGTSWAVMI